MILHHLSQKFLGEDPKNQNYHVKCVFCREGIAVVQKKPMPPTVINLYVNNCLESRFKSYNLPGERTTTNPLFLLFSLLFFFFFFFCFSKFNESLDPLTKIPGSAPAIDAPFLVQNGRVCGVGDRYNYVHKLHITRFSLFYHFTVFMSTAHSVADRAKRCD